MFHQTSYLFNLQVEHKYTKSCTKVKLFLTKTGPTPPENVVTLPDKNSLHKTGKKESTGGRLTKLLSSGKNRNISTNNRYGLR